MHRRHITAVLVAAAVLVSLASPAAPAAAAAPVLDWSNPAPRAMPSGWLAPTLSLDADHAVLLPDGDVVYHDTYQHALIRVESTTGEPTAIAGDGRPEDDCGMFAVGDVALETRLPKLLDLAVDGTGRLYIQTTSIQAPCNTDAPLLRLAADGTWEAALHNPVGSAASAVGYGDFGSFAVAADGTVYASDPTRSLIRRYAPGQSSGPGVVVMGVAGSPGLGGDGGPGTSAQIEAPHLLARPGALFLRDGGTWDRSTVVRRLDLGTGQVTRVAGTGLAYNGSADGVHPVVGAQATSSNLTIEAMSATADGTRLALGLLRVDPATSTQQFDLVAFVPGGAVTNVRSADLLCSRSNVLLVAASPPSVVGCRNGLRSWALDGSQAAGMGEPFLGEDALRGRIPSPDGVTLDQLWPGEVESMAVSAGGAVALAGPFGVRTVPSLTASAIVALRTAAPSTAVHYDNAGTLYWAQDSGEVELRARTSAGATSIVAGGGSAPLTNGATATAVALPRVDAVATSADRRTVYLLAESGSADPENAGRRFRQVWSLDRSTGLVSLRVGSGSAAGTSVGQAASAAGLGRATHLAVDPSDGALWVATGNGVARFADGVVGEVELPRSDPVVTGLSFLPDGSLQAGASVMATDGTWTHFDGAFPGRAITSMADGSLLQERADDAGVLFTSPVIHPTTGAPRSSLEVVPGPGRLALTVTPPAVPGLTVRVELLQAAVPSQRAEIVTFTSNGSPTPRQFLLRRFASPGDTTGPPLDPSTVYWVRLVTEGADSETATSSFAAPGTDSIPPARPTSISSTGVRGQLLVHPGPADDLDHLAVCASLGSAAAASPDGCGPWAKRVPVTSPATALTIPIDASPALDPTVTHTFTAWSVDIQGNTSAAVSVTVAGATESVTDPGGQIPGVNWKAVGSSGVQLRFRGDPHAVRVVAGAGVPVPLPPGDGVEPGRTFSASGLLGGGTYTALLYLWNSGRTHYTVTKATFVAGTSSEEIARLVAPSTSAAGVRPTVTGQVSRRVVGQATTVAEAGIPVELWSRTAPSATWVKVATATTGAAGSASWLRPALTASTSYQLRVPAQGVLNPQVIASAVATTRLVPAVQASLSATIVKTRKVVKVRTQVRSYVSVLPGRATVVAVQKYSAGAWRTTTTRRTSTTGRLTWSWKPASRKKTVWRFIVPATAVSTAAASRSLTIVAR